jgi:glutamate synthase (NADPH/NADH) small chain
MGHLKKLDPVKMREQPVEERIKNFSEVALGLSEAEAMEEAKRCLQCKNPFCVKGCPVGIDIPAFIKKIVEGDPGPALEKILEKNNLPAICGRVCPQEDQCEKECILNKKNLAIRIGYLERFAADFGKRRNRPPDVFSKKNKKVAVVGSGPAGLTAAADLAKMGYEVAIFESLHDVGGVLTYGIPEFRLPKKIVHEEVDYIKKLGVEIFLDVVVGKTLTIEDFKKDGYGAFFIGSGAGLPSFMNIPGENLNGVYSANEFLTRVNLMKAYKFPEYSTPVKIGKKVAVVGAGNVAMDSARCSLRLGADEVTIVYRRTKAEMPARLEEIERAKEEGIKFKLLTLPIKLVGEKGWVKEMVCQQMKLGTPDESGRARPIPIPNSEFSLPVDLVVVAIGQKPNPLLLQTIPGLNISKWGTIIVGEKGATNLDGIFAGGDITTGAATVISAMGAAKIAALAIDEYLA